MNVYVSDLEVNDYDENQKEQKVWVIVSIDGCNTPQSTQIMPLSQKITFNYPMVFHFSSEIDITKQHIYVTLCTFQIDTKFEEMIPLGRARFRASHILYNSENSFYIPLLSCYDQEQIIARVLISAALINHQSNKSRASSEGSVQEVKSNRYVF